MTAEPAGTAEPAPGVTAAGPGAHDPIGELIERERRLRAELAEIRPALERVLIEQALAVRDDAKRKEGLVRQLYWEVPAIPVTVIRVAFGVKGQVADVAGPGPELGPCTRCGTSVLASSRSDLTQRGYGRSPVRCERCRHEELIRRWEPEPWESDAFLDWSGGVDDAPEPVVQQPSDDEPVRGRLPW